MNRIIKFRGKRIDNGEWVVGNYLQRHDSFGALALIEVQDMEDFEINTYQVYPETVGQFTCLTDKKDNEVYEGDICRHLTENDIYMVVYGASASYQRKYINHFGAEGIDTLRFYNSTASQSIVIGNIHDNPELLNPAKGAVTNNMNSNYIDPKEGQEEVKQEGTASEAVEAGEAIEGAEGNSEG